MLLRCRGDRRMEMIRRERRRMGQHLFDTQKETKANYETDIQRKDVRKDARRAKKRWA